MIEIIDKSTCCGCGACAQACPNVCITMQEDKHGFLYPYVNYDKCVDCKICEQVCQYKKEKNVIVPVISYAAVNIDEQIRMKSSSGGIFNILAENVIKQEGVVFGARFDEYWRVVHDYAETIEELEVFRGSKYLQSIIGDNFKIAERFLCDGRLVLFSGTPCQISGLKHYLRKNYENLITVEVACHGVPSPLVWSEYIRGKNINIINFRDKSSGWKDYSIRIGNILRSHNCDDYMNCFLGDYSLRPSCFNCHSKYGSSGANIMIADLWGISSIAPEIDDNKGTSAVICWDERGKNVITNLMMIKLNIDFNKIFCNNPAIEKSANKPYLYEDFWFLFLSNPQKAIKKFGSLNRPSKWLLIKSRLYNFIHK